VLPPLVATDATRESVADLRERTAAAIRGRLTGASKDVADGPAVR